MRITDSEAELRRQLIASGLDPEHLEPWEAWKGFMRFLATPMAIDDDGISVQCRREEVADGEFMVSMQWIRHGAGASRAGPAPDGAGQAAAEGGRGTGRLVGVGGRIRLRDCATAPRWALDRPGGTGGAHVPRRAPIELVRGAAG